MKINKLHLRDDDEITQTQLYTPPNPIESHLNCKKESALRCPHIFSYFYYLFWMNEARKELT